MVNISLESGHFLSAWEEALVQPILKKNGLDTVFKNYRPVSNLSFVSKVTERAVFHMKKHDLYPSLQSAYRKNHSTEKALLKVTNDILVEMNSQHAVLHVLLDLSPAFDTVDHSVLLRWLQTLFGISGAPLEWFKSYLSARSQRVPFPAPSLTVSLLTGAFHKGPVLVHCCTSSTLQSYLTSLNVNFQILTVMRMIHKYICPSSPMNCQVNKML